MEQQFSGICVGVVMLLASPTAGFLSSFCVESLLKEKLPAHVPKKCYRIDLKESLIIVNLNTHDCKFHADDCTS